MFLIVWFVRTWEIVFRYVCRNSENFCWYFSRNKTNNCYKSVANSQLFLPFKMRNSFYTKSPTILTQPWCKYSKRLQRLRLLTTLSSKETKESRYVCFDPNRCVWFLIVKPFFKKVSSQIWRCFTLGCLSIILHKYL